MTPKTTTADVDGCVESDESSDEGANGIDELPTRPQFFEAIETIRKYIRNANVSVDFLLATDLINNEYIKSNPSNKFKQTLIPQYFKS